MIVSTRVFAGLIEVLVFPRIISLDKPASRCLLSLAIECTKICPRGAIEELLLPLLKSENSGVHQSELVGRCLISGMDSEMQITFTRLGYKKKKKLFKKSKF